MARSPSATHTETTDGATVQPLAPCARKQANPSAATNSQTAGGLQMKLRAVKIRMPARLPSRLAL